MSVTTTLLEEATQAILALDKEFMRNVTARAPEKLVEAFYTADAKVLPPDMPPVIGKPAILGLFQGLLAGGLKALDLDTTQVEASGDLAFGIGSYKLTLQPPGSDEIVDHGKYLVAYRRQSGGGYLAIADMFSSNQKAGASQ